MLRKDASAAVLFVVLSIAMTWPLARNLERAVADPGDPYITIWALDWDHYASFHRPLSLFDANQFHPARHTLAFSENLYGIALFLIPFRAAGVTPIAAHNIALLAGFAFCGLAAYLLGRMISGSAAAGVAAGIFYAFVPYRFTHIVHIQHVFGGWLPMTLAALIHYSRKPSRGRAALFGAAFLMNGLTNIHLLLFATIMIVATAGILVMTGTRRWLPLAVTTAIACVLLVPFLLPYQQAANAYGMERGWEEARSYSAEPSDWLASNRVGATYGALFREGLDPERWLFPGLLSLILATAGVIVAARRDRQALAIASVWLVTGFFGSLGMHAIFHRFLFAHVPGFRAIRVPARWAIVAYVGLAILIAIATAAASRRRPWIATVIAVAFLLELRAVPLRWYMAVPEVPEVYRWLSTADVHGGTLEVPYQRVGTEYYYLLRATAHHRPILNGISGFGTPDSARLGAMMHETPLSGETITQLRKMDCELIVVHDDYLDATTRAWIAKEVSARRLHFVRRFDGGQRGDWVFTLADVPHVITADLGAFLRGDITASRTTFGALDTPLPATTAGPSLRMTGWAFSADGIRGIDLLFEQGTVRIHANQWIADPGLSRGFHYPEVRTPRFVLTFDRRPEGVRRETDVQMEIIDGRGRRTRLEDRFFEWTD